MGPRLVDLGVDPEVPREADLEAHRQALFQWEEAKAAARHQIDATASQFRCRSETSRTITTPDRSSATSRRRCSVSRISRRAQVLEFSQRARTTGGWNCRRASRSDMASRLIAIAGLSGCLWSQSLKKVATIDLPGPKGQRFDYLTTDDEGRYTYSLWGPGKILAR